MIILTVIVSEECEGLIGSLPKGYEYELLEEEYSESTGKGRIDIRIYDLPDLTIGIANRLDALPGVLSYWWE